MNGLRPSLLIGSHSGETAQLLYMKAVHFWAPTQPGWQQRVPERVDHLPPARLSWLLSHSQHFPPFRILPVQPQVRPLSLCFRRLCSSSLSHTQLLHLAKQDLLFGVTEVVLCQVVGAFYLIPLSPTAFSHCLIPSS